MIPSLFYSSSKTAPLCPWLLAAILILLPWWATPETWAAEDTNEAAAQLAQIIYVAPPSNGNESSAALYRALYWMHVGVRPGTPAEVLALRAQYRAKGTAELGPLEWQLLADVGMADTYGLFTPENLVCLQGGAPPVATRGLFVGKRIGVVKIRPEDHDYSLVNAALCAEGTPLPVQACSPNNRPTPKTTMAGQSILAPDVTMASAPSSTSLQTPPPTPAPYLMRGPANTWTRGGPMVYPGTSQSSAPLAATAPNPADRVQLSDLPFNAMLPINAKVKLGIARVEGNEITVSILGEREVILQGPTGGKNTYHPSVDKIKVLKNNPVHLPGVSANAYLIYTIPAGSAGPEMRWYFIDTSVDNGMVFRIARAVGPP